MQRLTKISKTASFTLKLLIIDLLNSELFYLTFRTMMSFEDSHTLVKMTARVITYLKYLEQDE